MAPTPLLAEPLAQIQSAIDRLGQEDLQLVPGACLGDDLRGIRCVIDRLEAEFSRRLERFDRNQGWVPDGNASTAGWLSEQCRVTSRGAPPGSGCVRRGAWTSCPAPLRHSRQVRSPRRMWG
jgi:hypothetical protein